jgi:hypothetical protein
MYNKELGCVLLEAMHANRKIQTKPVRIDQVALGQVFFRVLPLSPINIIPARLSTLIYRVGDEQQARWWPQFRESYLIDMNNNKPVRTSLQ